MELRDRTGSIPARAFRDVDRLAGRFERGDPIRVSGKVERFRGDLVAEVEDIQPIDSAELDPAEFLPAAYRDAEELDGFFEHLTREVHDPALRQVVERALFTEPVASDFRRAPCTRPATTPTWAGCSSTRWPSRPWSWRSASCTRASIRTC